MIFSPSHSYDKYTHRAERLKACAFLPQGSFNKAGDVTETKTRAELVQTGGQEIFCLHLSRGSTLCKCLALIILHVTLYHTDSLVCESQVSSVLLQLRERRYKQENDRMK